jgi:3-phenylpropionate/trans-cinnamate dioxygenase ferredoxin reductase component
MFISGENFMNGNYDYVIVGAGLAGASAAAAIRELDASGSVLVLGAESEPPYHRPPLSKGLWLGKESEDQIYVKPPADWQSLHVEFRLGDPVQALDLAAQQVVTAGGARLSFRKLLLAMGGEPRRLPVPEDVQDRMLYLRDLGDYRRLRELARTDGEVLVIGGSFIGAEMACALAVQPGIKVSMVFPGVSPLAQILPHPLTQVVNDLYQERGVQLYPEDRVVELAPGARGLRVRTGQGYDIQADWALAGVGLVPATRIAETAGLQVDGGLKVNSKLQTSHADVYAAGDLAVYPDPVWGEPVRVEHWDNAQATGRTAGRNMTGQDEPYTHQSMFFSDLFDLGFEAVGNLSSRLETFVDMDAEWRKGVVYYLKAGMVQGVLLWNTWEQVDAARNLIAAKETVFPADLKGRLG